MDPFEATNVLFSKIKSLDPEHASKIMGCLLIQDLGERELVRLAFGPEALLHSVILKTKTLLGLSSNTASTPSTPSSPSPLNPISRPGFNNSNPFSQSSPRNASNGFLNFTKDPSSPSSHSWPHSGLTNNHAIGPKSSPFLSYDNIRSGSHLVPLFSHDNGGDSSNNGAFVDEYQLNDYLSFLDDPTSNNEEFGDSRLQMGYALNNGDTHFHRRSFSASDASLGSENADFGIGGAIVGSPSKIDTVFQREEMMRMKASEQQRLAASSQFIPGALSMSYDKSMNFLLRQQSDPQRVAAAALMMEEFYKFGRCRPERNDILPMGLADKSNSALRQIYLTFPADSTFRDEDVSNYFNNFGPVQDVRIPYQQKRMFGFVTFVHPETVKLILARGNPHFICDSRVLVKPYKEKGKLPEKRQPHFHQQQLEKGNLSPCSSPSGLDCRESYDLHLGAKMFYQTRQMILRKKLEEEQVDLQQAIELQRRRFMNLQLPDLNNHYVPHHQRSLSVGSPISPPGHAYMNQNAVLPFDGINKKLKEVNGDYSAAMIHSNATAEKLLHQEVKAACVQGNGCDHNNGESSKAQGCDVHECHESSVEHVLPDSLFSSPKKSAEGKLSEFTPLAEVDESTAGNNPAPATTSTCDVSSQ